MEELIKKRGRVKAKLTRICTYILQIDFDVTTATQIKTRMDMLQEIWSEFDLLQTQIECLCSDSELDSQQVEQVDFELKFCDVKAELLDAFDKLSGVKAKLVDSMTDGSELPTGQSSHIKLPIIELPTFAGEYKKWTSFSDLFISVIHNNTTLSPVQKLHYLKSAVRGDASRLLNSISVTDANYNEAWKILSDRYSNRRQIVQSHLKTLYAQPGLHHESAKDLRELLDVTVENVRALHALGLPTEQWDCLLVFLVIERLDGNTRRQWELSIAEHEEATFSELKEFIEKRCRALEASRLGKEKVFMGKNIHNQSNRQSNTSISYHVTSLSCAKCKGGHAIYTCDQFLKLPIPQRIQVIKQLALCFNCLRRGHTSDECKSSMCKKCHYHHNTLLHVEREKNHTDSSKTVISNNFRSHQANHIQVMLATAMVKVKDCVGNNKLCRALLDSGSQASFISNACARQLGLKRHKTHVRVNGLGLIGTRNPKGIVRLQLMSTHSPYTVNFQALILPEITGKLPLQPVDPSMCAKLIEKHKMNLADPKYFEPGNIDLLIGADIYYDLLLNEGIKESTSAPAFQNTTLGWIVSGPINSESINSHIASYFSLYDLSQELKRFWEIEEISQSRNYTKEETQCEEYFKVTHSRNADGRYVVRLPFSDDVINLGDTQNVARNRLLQIERKLEHHQARKNQYIEFMDEYERLNHMEMVNKEKINYKPCYYLPHHCVINDTSSTTKLRVVFDGTARPPSGLSINEALLVGPTIQDDLVNIIMRFRVHNIVFTADITKMYRQILIHREDCNYQRILWRTSTAVPIKEYQLNTITYGTASAPFLAIRCLHQLANDERSKYPQGAEILLKDFYVDDLLSGADSVEEALQLQSQLINLLASGGFELRKWSSNDRNLIVNLPDNLCNDTIDLNLPSDRIQKILGLHWHSANDNFTFKVSSGLTTTVTKRTILAETSKLFDPLGWIAPVILRAKVMMQQLWLLGVTWDEKLPEDIITHWRQYMKELPMIEQIKIHRQIVQDSKIKQYEIHGFCDASEKAYGAVVFLRSGNNENQITVQLVCAKSKVAPVKRVSLPRLELCGALILARLLNKVSSVLSINNDKLYAWTDSSIVLSWLNQHAHQWKTFIANRVSEIQNLIRPENWRHVKSHENPADCLSRGLLPSQIINHSMWWKGPTWLTLDSSEWPTNNKTIVNYDQEVLKEQRQELIAFTTIKCEPTLINQYSSLSRLIRITAYCVRFINNSRMPKEKRELEFLTTKELQNSLQFWIKNAQAEVFTQEIKNCSNNKLLSTKSPLLSLNPFLDSNGILRVGGRLQEALIPYNNKHPIILPHHHSLTDLLIKHTHLSNLHAGPQLLLTILRQNYWILRARQTIRRYIHRCITCFRHKVTTSQQLMGNLPHNRVEPARAFLRCGIDYAGPFTLRLARGCGRIKTYKAYICIFTCFTTRAIHLELINDMTTNSFIAALRRFISRRGKPSDIYTDCGTNFVGANHELNKLNKLVTSKNHNQSVSQLLAEGGTTWHFNPPSSPHFGGLWEAGVKSLKYHLRRTVGNAILTYEEFYTLLTQVEACLNSRPLCPLSSEPNEFEVLTPGHFLIGEALTSIPEPELTPLNANRLVRWQLIQRLFQQFWKQWTSEYLSRLQQRPKWMSPKINIAVGDLVLLKNEDLSPLKWPMARVVQVHPGKDNLVRIVTIKTKTGLYKRPVTKCCVLPIDN